MGGRSRISRTADTKDESKSHVLIGRGSLILWMSKLWLMSRFGFADPATPSNNATGQVSSCFNGLEPGPL